MRHNENAGCGKCGKRKCGTRLQVAGVENAGKVACVIKLNQPKVNDKRVE